MECGSFVIAHSNTAWFYIGEVLDIYKKGTGSYYGSVDFVDTVSQVWFLSLRVYLLLSQVWPDCYFG